MDYQLIFNCLDNEIKDKYYHFSRTLDDYLNINLDLKLDKCAERSIAYFSTWILERIFKTSGYNCICVNESKFNPNFKITPTIKDESRKHSGIDKSNVKNKGNYFIPDSTFLINDKPIFVEYKVYKKLKHFYDLAADFYKYKLYTYKSSVDSCFIYISFINNDGLPDLIRPGQSEPNIQFIGNVISSSTINKDSAIYIKDFEGISNLDDNFDIDIERYESLLKISNNLDEIIENESFKNINTIDYLKDNVFILSKDQYTPKVITAFIIRNNFKSIKEVYDKFYNDSYLKDTFDKLKLNYDSNSNVDNIKTYIDWSSEYFNNQINHITDEIKPGNTYLYKTFRNKSLYIVYLIDEYSKEKGYNLNFNYYNDKLNEKENVSELKSVLSTFYKKQNYKVKLNLLIESIIYFICNLYPIIYKENDEGELEYNDAYNLYIEKENLIRNMKSLNRKLKFTKRIEWNSDFETLGYDVFQSTLESFKKKL